MILGLCFEPDVVTFWWLIVGITHNCMSHLVYHIYVFMLYVGFVLLRLSDWKTVEVKLDYLFWLSYFLYLFIIHLWVLLVMRMVNLQTLSQDQVSFFLANWLLWSKVVNLWCLGQSGFVFIFSAILYVLTLCFHRRKNALLDQVVIHRFFDLISDY